jgi:hypothetical protein
MLNLTDKQIAEYFKRSYMAVDGLWFVKLEELHGFDTALNLDDLVWQIMPKIQARKLKSLLPLKDGMEGLREGYTTKLSLDGYEFQTQPTDTGFDVCVTRCPWHDIIVNAGRKHLAEKISPRICTADATGWAKEFGKDIAFSLTDGICRGNTSCRLCFHRNSNFS